MKNIYPTVSESDPEVLVALDEFCLALSSTMDEAEMAEAMVQVVEALFSTKLAAVLLAEKTPASLSVAAVRSKGKVVHDELEKLLCAAQVQLGSADFQMQKWVSYPAVELADSVEVRGLAMVGLRSLALVPLTHSGRCLGVLALAEDSERGFSSTEFLTIMLMAKQAGGAIGKARLYKEASARAARFSFLSETAATLTSLIEPSKLFPKILTELDKLIRFSQAGLYLYDEEKQTYRMLASKGLTPKEQSEGEATAMERHPGWVFRHRQPLLVEDVLSDGRIDYCYLREKKRPRATLCVPIVFEDQCLGCISLSSCTPGAFTYADLQVVTAFANNAAIAIENARLHEKTQHSLIRLHSMQDIIQQVSANLELSKLLPEIVKAAALTIDASFAWLALIKPDSTVVKPAASYRLEDGFVRYLAVTIDDSPTSHGPTGRAIRLKCPQLVRDCQKELPLEVWREATAKYGYQSELAVPLMYEDRVLGAITVYSRKIDAFDRDDIDLLKAFANQAAIAIENARLYEREKQTVVKLQELNDLTTSQHAMLQRAISSQLQLTEMVLEDKGIECITRTLANLVSNPVTVVDRFFKLISHSSSQGPLDPHRQETIARLGIPEEVLQHPKIRALLDTTIRELHPAFIPPIPECRMDKARVLAPIVAAKEILGYVSILESGRKLEELDLMILQKAAVVMALEIMKQRTGFEVELRLKGDFLKDLLSVSDEEDQGVLRRAAFLGYDLSKPSYLLIVRVDYESLCGLADQAAEKEIIELRTQVLKVVQAFSANRLPHSLVIGENEVIDILIPSKTIKNGREQEVDPFDFAKALKTEINRYFSSRCTVSIGVGSECVKLVDFRKAYDEAINYLQIGRLLNQKDSVLSFQHLGAYHVLFQCRSRDVLASFVEGVLGRLGRYDCKNRSNLLQTLEAYLDNGESLQNTAKALFVHPNTVNYRLRRIEEIGGIDLQSAEGRFNLQLALKIRQLIDAPKSTSTRF